MLQAISGSALTRLHRSRTYGSACVLADRRLRRAPAAACGDIYSIAARAIQPVNFTREGEEPAFLGP